MRGIFIKMFERKKLYVITYIVPNFSTLKPYVENSIICSDCWNSISHFAGQLSVITMYFPNRVKKVWKTEGKSWLWNLYINTAS